MKKFKHSISVKGERHHLEAFVKDLERLGYLKSEKSPVLAENYSHVVTYYNFSANGYYGFCNNLNPKDFSFTLPSQWQEALLKASEVEEQEEFKDGDWIVFEDFGSLNPGTSFSLNVPYLLCDNRLNFKMDDMGHHNGWSSFTVETAIKEKGIKIRKATPEEIKSRLLKLAKDKGFVKGVRFKTIINIFGQDESFVDNILFDYYYKNGEIYLCTNGAIIYYQGNWAEIIPSHPSITINGYKAEFKEWGISFNNGCAKIDKKIFIDLNDLIYEGVGGGNKSITSVKIGAGEFTSEQIKEIAEYYNK